jgi:IS5 family transposase
VYFVQQWYSLSDEAVEDAIYDSQGMRAFVGVGLARETALAATTVLKFRRLLEKNELTQRMFVAINIMLTQKRFAHALGHHRRHDDHQRAAVDQECSTPTRWRPAPDEKRQRVVLRHKKVLSAILMMQ